MTEQEAMELNLHIREQEINAVKNLGEKIGYGNLMDIAAALWAMKMSADGIERIMHVPTVESCMKKEEWERTRKEVLLRIEEIREHGIYPEKKVSLTKVTREEAETVLNKSQNEINVDIEMD